MGTDRRPGTGAEGASQDPSAWRRLRRTPTRVISGSDFAAFVGPPATPFPPVAKTPSSEGVCRACTSQRGERHRSESSSRLVWAKRQHGDLRAMPAFPARWAGYPRHDLRKGRPLAAGRVRRSVLELPAGAAPLGAWLSHLGTGRSAPQGCLDNPAQPTPLWGGNFFTRAPRGLARAPPSGNGRSAQRALPRPHSLRRPARFEAIPTRLKDRPTPSGQVDAALGAAPGPERCEHRVTNAARQTLRRSPSPDPGRHRSASPPDLVRIARLGACRRGRRGARPAPQRPAALRALPTLVAAQLPALPAPLGFHPHRLGPTKRHRRSQHKMGPDPPARPS